MTNILYVSAHNPFPALSGGQVDIWNRIRAFRQLGVAVDLVLTTKGPLAPEHRATIAAEVRELTVVERRPLANSLLSRRPVQMAVRSGLRTLDLGGREYDLLLLDNEFGGEILCNPSLRARKIALRIHNDEAAYQRRLAAAAGNPLLALYLREEARRMSRYLPRLWQRADALWFISSDELAAARQTRPRADLHFVPAGLDLGKAGSPPLLSDDVLFVGSLAVTLNQDAIRWYLRHVHPLMLATPGYTFTVAGSTLGQDLQGFMREVAAHPRVRLRCDVPDLAELFSTSAAFASPMRLGAGVKLKTVEAALRGLPLVSTSVGAEGSGLIDGLHCHVADQPELFAAALQQVLADRKHALALRDAAQQFISLHYDQTRSLGRALDALGLPC